MAYAAILLVRKERYFEYFTGFCCHLKIKTKKSDKCEGKIIFILQNNQKCSKNVAR